MAWREENRPRCSSLSRYIYLQLRPVHACIQVEALAARLQSRKLIMLSGGIWTIDSPPLDQVDDAPTRNHVLVDGELGARVVPIWGVVGQDECTQARN